MTPRVSQSVEWRLRNLAFNSRWLFWMVISVALILGLLPVRIYAQSNGIPAQSSVVAWGKIGVPTDLTNVVVPPDLTNVVAIDSDGLALRADGTVINWNKGPVIPSGLSNVTAIANGWGFGLALNANGNVTAWGDNSAGQTNVPAGLSNVIAISAGSTTKHALALQANGNVVAWGNGGFGATIIPSGLSNVIAIGSGYIHNLVLKSDGTVVAFGANNYGQTNVPVGLSNVIAISAGGFHNLALKSDGTVVAWGWNDSGQAVVPLGLSNVVAISAGYAHSVALKSDGKLVAWGRNEEGQTTVPNGLNCISVAAGSYNTTALVAPPTSLTIFSQPKSIAINLNESANFSVAALGPAPMNYQWRFSGVDIPGETNYTYTRTNAQFSDAGNYCVVVNNDGGAITSSVAVLTVNAPPAAPVITSQPQSQTVSQGGSVTFSVTATGNPSPYYRWLFNGTKMLANSLQSSFTLNNVQPTNAGTYSVVISNGFNLASSNAVLTVLAAVPPTNSPPVLAGISVKAVNEGTTLSFTNSASDSDIPPNILTFSLTNAPTGATINPTNGIFTWTPTEAQGPSTNSITIVVTDNGTPPMSNSKTFSVIVNEVNSAPSLSAIPETVVRAGTSVNVAASATDSDLPVNTLTFTIDGDVPSGAAIDSASGVFTWTAPPVATLKTNSVTVHVTDDGSPSLSDAKTFTLVTVPPSRTLHVVNPTEGTVILSLETYPGKTYRLQYKDDLNDANWTDADEIVSSGSSLSVTNNVGITNDIGVIFQRYYRVLQVE